MQITGLVVVRNFLEFDYIPTIAAESMLPYCDKVVISDMQSDDGSYEALQDWAANQPRVEIRSQPWNKPHRNIYWWVNALNYARQFLDPGWLLQLDADEVLMPTCGSGIATAMAQGRPAFFRRLNFWQDARHLAPENHYCGTYVARLGPTDLYLCSDEPNPAVHPNIRTNADYYSGLEIAHYGAIRNPDAFIRKSEVVQDAFFGSCDQRLLDAKASGQDWRSREYFDLPLRPYNGPHPVVAHAWLRSRGYSITQ